MVFSKVGSCKKRASCWIIRGVFAILIAILTSWFTHKQWLPWLCSWLNTSENPQQADFIVYLGGDESKRAELAADLYLDRYAARIIASGHSRNIQQGLDILNDKGIPQEFIIVNEQAKNTWSEAHQILTILGEQGATSALIVTSGSHTRRARATFEKQQGDAKISLIFVGTESRYTCQTWWNTPGGKWDVRHEYPKILYYFLRYGVVPF